MNYLSLAVVTIVLVSGILIATPKVQEKDTITVGIYPHMPPYQYIENGELKGFEIDLIKAP